MNENKIDTMEFLLNSKPYKKSCVIVFIEIRIQIVS